MHSNIWHHCLPPFHTQRIKKEAISLYILRTAHRAGYICENDQPDAHYFIYLFQLCYPIHVLNKQFIIRRLLLFMRHIAFSCWNYVQNYGDQLAWQVVTYFVRQGSAGIWGYAHLTQVSIILYMNNPHNFNIISTWKCYMLCVQK